MTRKSKRVIIWSILFLITIDFYHALIYYKDFYFSNTVKIYLLIHILCIMWFIRLIFLDFKNKNGIINSIKSKVRLSKMPKAAIFVTSIVFFGNMLSISLGKPCYPFYDVGMFRWTTSFENKPKIVYQPKYFFYSDDEINILDLRREGFLFYRKYLDITYSHIFTFSANYHNRSRKETFEYLSEIMSSNGVDTLWVGVQSVNFQTKEIKFNSDICNAIKINKKDLHYGPLYIPDYQNIKCCE